MILVNPFEKDPDETYRAYQRFRKRNEYDKAYRCIENLLQAVSGRYGALGGNRRSDPGSDARPGPRTTVADAPDQAGLLLAGLRPLKRD